MIIIKTMPGHAGPVAHKIDNVIITDKILKDKIRGSIAGDDTVFVATNGENNLEWIEEKLKAVL